MLLRAFSNNYDYTNSTANQEQVTPSIRPLSEFCDTAETNEEFAYNDSHLLHFDSFCEDRRGGEPGGRLGRQMGEFCFLKSSLTP